MVGFCEHGDGASGSIKKGFFDELGDIQLFK
jgi:hypothetical protein